MNWETINFFGDSLTFGARSYLGYPEYVGDILQKQLSKSWNVINHATNGFTAVDLARSITNDFYNLSSNGPLLSVILIGTNDAKNNTPDDDYRIALEQVIIKSKLMTENGNVLLLNLPSFPNGVMYPYTTKMNDNINRYNHIINELTEKHQVKSLGIPIEEEHLYDGVHFNQPGCVHYAQNLARHILKERGL
jgi:lysophospholipase L1-like esterase